MVWQALFQEEFKQQILKCSAWQTFLVIPALIPQIMKGVGIKYLLLLNFLTYNGGDPFPYNLFTWEGIDGSTVLAHIFNDYGSETRLKR